MACNRVVRTVTKWKMHVLSKTYQKRAVTTQLQIMQEHTSIKLGLLLLIAYGRTHFQNCGGEILVK